MKTVEIDLYRFNELPLCVQNKIFRKESEKAFQLSQWEDELIARQANEARFEINTSTRKPITFPCNDGRHLIFDLTLNTFRPYLANNKPNWYFYSYGVQPIVQVTLSTGCIPATFEINRDLIDPELQMAVEEKLKTFIAFMSGWMHQKVNSVRPDIEQKLSSIWFLKNGETYKKTGLEKEMKENHG